MSYNSLLALWGYKTLPSNLRKGMGIEDLEESIEALERTIEGLEKKH